MMPSASFTFPPSFPPHSPRILPCASRASSQLPARSLSCTSCRTVSSARGGCGPCCARLSSAPTRHTVSRAPASPRLRPTRTSGKSVQGPGLRPGSSGVRASLVPSAQVPMVPYFHPLALVQGPPRAAGFWHYRIRVSRNLSLCRPALQPLCLLPFLPLEFLDFLFPVMEQFRVARRALFFAVLGDAAVKGSDAFPVLLFVAHPSIASVSRKAAFTASNSAFSSTNRILGLPRLSSRSARWASSSRSTVSLARPWP